MILLNLPKYEIKVHADRHGKKILDILRRKYVALTPEEWVRQHFIHFLIEHKGYPSALMANEVPLSCGNKKLRADTVLYDRSLHPRMIIEYKAPTIKISRHVFEQITAYNMLLHVDYLVVSNGIEHYCCQMNYEEQTYTFLKTIPYYCDIINTDGSKNSEGEH